MDGDEWAGRGQAIYWDHVKRNGLWVGRMYDGTRRLGVRVEGRVVALFELEDEEIMDLCDLLSDLLVQSKDPQKVN